jgi:hypothetical protein
MSENSILLEVTEIPTFSRRACLEDFLDEGDQHIQSGKNKHNRNNSQNDTIAKNQQEFGHKKRIKP